MRAVEFLCEKPVESSWIPNLTYNRPNKILTMRISNGRTFSIPGITRTMFERWCKAPSKGSFWHQVIKPTYKATRIK